MVPAAQTMNIVRAEKSCCAPSAPREATASACDGSAGWGKDAEDAPGLSCAMESLMREGIIRAANPVTAHGADRTGGRSAMQSTVSHSAWRNRAEKLLVVQATAQAIGTTMARWRLF